MKFGQVVRVTEDKRSTRRKIRDFIDQNPGTTSRAIAHSLGRSAEAEKIARQVYQLSKGPNPIQKKLLDNKMRFYPPNYALTGNEVPPHLDETVTCEDCGRQFINIQALRMHQQRAHQGMGPQRERPKQTAKVTTPAPNQSVTDLAKAYFWLHSNDSLHGFVDWVEKGNITEYNKDHGSPK